jgi:hypothetical protein
LGKYDLTHRRTIGNDKILREENTLQLSRKKFITSVLLRIGPFGTSQSVIVPHCCRTARIIADAGTTYFLTPRRSRQPLIQMSSM